MKVPSITAALAVILLGSTSVSARAILSSDTSPRAAKQYDSLNTEAGKAASLASPTDKHSSEWDMSLKYYVPRVELDPDIFLGDDSAAGDDSAGEEGASEGSAPMSVSNPSSGSESVDDGTGLASDPMDSSLAHDPPSTPEAQPIEPPESEVGEEIPEGLENMFQDAVNLFKQGGIYAIGRDETMLYAGPADMEKLSQTYAQQNGLRHFNEYSEMLDDEHEQYATVEEGYSTLLSAAIGRTAWGDVKLMSPPTGLTGKGILTDTEWPELVSNGRVTSVTWIDSKNSANQLVIWRPFQGPIPFPIGTSTADMAQEAAVRP